MYKVIEILKTIGELENDLEKPGNKIFFTEREIIQCEKKHKIKSLGARYVIKKSIMDFFDLNTNYQNIEILNNTVGKPEIHYTDEILNIIKSKSAGNIQISISHSRNYVASLVIIE